MRQQPVNASYANVGNQLDSVAHQPRSHHGFLGHRQIAGARANHGDHSLAGNGCSLCERYGARHLMKFGARFNCMNGFEHLACRARSQHIASGLYHAHKNLRHLPGGLARGKNHLWHPSAQRAVMIDFSEAQVFEWQILQPVNRIINLQAALAYIVQQRFNVCAVHQSFSFVSA